MTTPADEGIRAARADDEIREDTEMETQTMISWTNDIETMHTQGAIARRAVVMAASIGAEYDQMTVVMDIDACHSNGCPLKLTELLAADDFDFAHDVFGIRRHIDRTTGKLRGCFLPRYAI